MTFRLVRVVAPHFVAGFVTNGCMTFSAPILNYMIGWRDDRARAYMLGKKWRATVVSEWDE